MNTNALRRVIADMFPHSYSRWSWRNLLTDFVEVHLKALAVRWLIHRVYGTSSEEPTGSEILKKATVELAKHQGLSYEYLAQSYYEQKYKMEVLSADNDELRQKLDKTSLPELLPSLTPAFVEEPKEQNAINSAFANLTDDINSTFINLTGVTDEKADKIAILEAYVSEQYKVYQQQVDQYAEAVDLEDKDAEYIAPVPHIELYVALTILAIYRGKRFQDVAFEAYDSGATVLGERKTRETAEGVALKYKKLAERATQAAEYWYQMYLLKNNLDNRSN